MIVTRCLPALLAAFVLSSSLLAQSSRDPDTDSDRALRHQSDDWQAVAPHLPDPETGTPQALQTAGDVLRARRLPEDALDYYRYALARGGDEETIWNSIGVTELELANISAARAAFKRAVQLRKKDAKAWNNLGSAEFMAHNLRAALEDYLRAVRLSKKTAVFHSNLGSAYFEMKDYDSARKEFQRAVKFDHNVFHDGGWAGSQAHVMSLSDRGRFCFEMAKIAAHQHDDATTIRFLGRAAESGFDIITEMSGDRDFQAYWKDPRVATLVKNSKLMRANKLASTARLPTLPDPTTP